MQAAQEDHFISHSNIKSLKGRIFVCEQEKGKIGLICIMSIPLLKGYATTEKIGSGSYSTVYKAFKKDGSREVVAIKCVSKNKLSRSAIDNIITEITLLKVLKHQYIVEMRDFQWDERFIYIIMEFCEGGDLSRFIQRRKKLPEKVCHRFLQQLAVALRFLRSHNVCHMDLKPQNLLLTTKPQLTLKLGAISSECRDLLTRLLQHDPDQRISYEDFFDHPFLDLEHFPSNESYEKAVHLVCDAVKCDRDKNFVEAYSLYCEALKYFIPLVHEEVDVNKKIALRTKVNSYIKRAEDLKQIVYGPSPEKTSLQDINATNFKELCRLCSATPGLTSALEIGRDAELYMAEGQYPTALEKFEACLGVLVPAIGKEPKGHRRDLMHSQIGAEPNDKLHHAMF
ncbi:Serine/threonine-protein kinase ULK3 [Gryllus bimaculatus]|nr:Serine/threonine-protein kinase ULK3 [Gryllus bimaculatus]